MKLKSKKSVVYKHPEFGVLNFYFNLRAMELFAQKQEQEGVKNGLRMYAEIAYCALAANDHINDSLPDDFSSDDVLDVFDEMEPAEFKKLKSVMESSLSDFAEKFDIEQPQKTNTESKDGDKKK